MKGIFGSCQYIQYRKSRNKFFFFVQTRRLNSTIRNLMKYKYIFYLCCIFLSGCNKAPVKKSEILWDTYGVPHIFADNYEDMFYAYGWAQMRNHGNLLLQLYAQARGQGAEYLVKNTCNLINGCIPIMWWKDRANGWKNRIQIYGKCWKLLLMALTLTQRRIQMKLIMCTN